ncbi:GntR family transcriptional regulator [Pseudarthrobacter sp. Y6]|uniref:GntR family transcriptional regulator n=1 Tax=Pseudarthrobacter sp. Y6 TaxID=3418422 RepID=UPI003CF1F75F
MINDSRPIFLQIAALIENDIVDGNLPEEAQVPSTNEFAAFHRINPAMAAKGVNLLVEEGFLYKRRGTGMFVCTGARAALVALPGCPGTRQREHQPFCRADLWPAGPQRGRLDHAVLPEAAASDSLTPPSGVGRVICATGPPR